MLLGAWFVVGHLAHAAIPMPVDPGPQPLADLEALLARLHPLCGAVLGRDPVDGATLLEGCEVVTDERQGVVDVSVDVPDRTVGRRPTDAEVAAWQAADVALLEELGFDPAEFGNVVTRRFASIDSDAGGEDMVTVLGTMTFVDRAIDGAAVLGGRAVVTRDTAGAVVHVTAAWPAIAPDAVLELSDTLDLTEAEAQALTPHPVVGTRAAVVLGPVQGGAVQAGWLCTEVEVLLDGPGGQARPGGSSCSTGRNSCCRSWRGTDRGFETRGGDVEMRAWMPVLAVASGPAAGCMGQHGDTGDTGCVVEEERPLGDLDESEWPAGDALRDSLDDFAAMEGTWSVTIDCEDDGDDGAATLSFSGCDTSETTLVTYVHDCGDAPATIECDSAALSLSGWDAWSYDGPAQFYMEENPAETIWLWRVATPGDDGEWGLAVFQDTEGLGVPQGKLEGFGDTGMPFEECEIVFDTQLSEGEGTARRALRGELPPEPPTCPVDLGPSASAPRG